MVTRLDTEVVTIIILLLLTETYSNPEAYSPYPVHYTD